MWIPHLGLVESPKVQGQGQCYCIWKNCFCWITIDGGGGNHFKIKMLEKLHNSINGELNCRETVTKNDILI
jgi:hypothetical protein